MAFIREHHRLIILGAVVFVGWYLQCRFANHDEDRGAGKVPLPNVDEVTAMEFRHVSPGLVSQDKTLTNALTIKVPIEQWASVLADFSRAFSRAERDPDPLKWGGPGGMLVITVDSGRRVYVPIYSRSGKRPDTMRYEDSYFNLETGESIEDIIESAYTASQQKQK